MKKIEAEFIVSIRRFRTEENDGQGVEFSAAPKFGILGDNNLINSLRNLADKVEQQQKNTEQGFVAKKENFGQ